LVKRRWNRNGSEHRLVTQNAGENRGWLYSPELLQRRKRKRNWLLDPTQQTNGSYYAGSTNYPGGKRNRGWQQVPENGNKRQRRRGQLRQQTNLMGGTNMRERVN
jgi:hypothetical protein